MNTWSLSLMSLLGQVTLLSAFTIVIYLIVRRRHPRAGASALLTGTLLCIVLTGLTFSPWPRWLGENEIRVDSMSVAAVGPEDFPDLEAASGVPGEVEEKRQPADASAARKSVTDPLTRLSRWWQIAVQQWNGFVDGAQRWAGLVATLLIASLVIGVVRLLAGWRCVRSCLRRSAVVRNRDLSELLDQLQAELSCPHRVELRECPLVTSPATVGWRWPVILLPANWRTWSTDERRTVLAHELAHIAANDSLSWLGAQLGLMLHFYHPFLHWLVHQLRIEQELAADATAAPLVGGSQAYLKTLAGLAVRQPDRPVAWPARPFLPERGTLLRRIEMLRDSRHRPEPASMFRRNLGIAAGVVAACLVAGLRPSTSTTVASGPQQTAETQQNQAPTVRDDAGRQDDQKPTPEDKNADAATLARMGSMNNAKRIALALHIYHNKNETFPPPVLLGPDGKTQHSWRVAVLPHLDEEALYKEYNLSQPWDSPQNRKVLETMPAVFRSPHAAKDSTNAAYFAVTGDQTALGNQPGRGNDVLKAATDGTSNTILIAEAKRDIPWTKPEDIPYSSDENVPQLGGFDEEGFVTAFADGAAHFLPAGLPADVLRSLITPNGGEAIDWGEIRRQRVR